MSLKDKFDDHKQKKEAKDFFRDNNDLYLDNNDLIKTILLGLVASLLLGFALSVIGNKLGYIMYVMYIGAGLVIAKLVVKIADVQSKQIAIISVVFTVITILSSVAFSVFLPGYTTVSFFMLSFVFRIFFRDPFNIIMLCIAAYTAYENAK